MVSHTHPEDACWPNIIGQPVAGTYYGVPFTGVAWKERAHTLTGQCRQITVRLPFPLDILGSVRSEILVSVCGACGESIDGFGESSLHLSREGMAR